MVAYKQLNMSNADQDEHTMISFTKTLNSFSDRDHSQACLPSSKKKNKYPNPHFRQFEVAMKFQASSPFINPSRASPNLVIRDNNRMSMAHAVSRAKAPTVCLTTGVLTESSLRRQTNSRYNNTQQVGMIHS